MSEYEMREEIARLVDECVIKYQDDKTGAALGECDRTAARILALFSPLSERVAELERLLEYALPEPRPEYGRLTHVVAHYDGGAVDTVYWTDICGGFDVDAARAILARSQAGAATSDPASAVPSVRTGETENG